MLNLFFVLFQLYSNQTSNRRGTGTGEPGKRKKYPHVRPQYIDWYDDIATRSIFSVSIATMEQVANERTDTSNRLAKSTYKFCYLKKERKKNLIGWWLCSSVLYSIRCTVHTHDVHTQVAVVHVARHRACSRYLRGTDDEAEGRKMYYIILLNFLIYYKICMYSWRV